MSTIPTQANLIEGPPGVLPEPDAEPIGADAEPIDFDPNLDVEVPSLEARVAALEAALREKSRLVTEYALSADERRKSRKRVRDLELAAEVAKDRAAKAKKAYEAALEDHLALEDSLATGQARLPLGDDGDGEPRSAAAVGPEAPADGYAPADEAWRAVPLCDLGGEPELAHGIVAALAEAGLATVGQLADWTFGGKVLTDVPGVGPAKAQAIEEALEAFWRRRGAEQGLAVEAGLRDGGARVDAGLGGATLGDPGFVPDSDYDPDV